MMPTYSLCRAITYILISGPFLLAINYFNGRYGAAEARFENSKRIPRNTLGIGRPDRKGLTKQALDANSGDNGDVDQDYLGAEDSRRELSESQRQPVISEASPVAEDSVERTAVPLFPKAINMGTQLGLASPSGLVPVLARTSVRKTTG